MKLSEIAEALAAEVIGDASLEVFRVVHPSDALGPSDLAIALTDEARSGINGSVAGAIVVAADAPRPANGGALLVYGGNERQAVATLTAMFDAGPAHDGGVHPAATVAADASLGDSVNVGPSAVIGHRTVLGDRTTVLVNVTIGADVRIGADCVFYPGVVIGDGVEIGDRVRIQANAVIGADGFGFIPAQAAPGGRPTRLHSLGTVVIGDDVEIGAGTTIDRATLRQTRIGAGTKIDNQVQIGHNVVIGESCLICGMVGIAGSAVIGDRVLVGAAAGISDHVTIGSGASIGALSGVATNVAANAIVSGIPADRHDRTMDSIVAVRRLKRLFTRVDELAKRLDSMEESTKGG